MEMMDYTCRGDRGVGAASAMTEQTDPVFGADITDESLALACIHYQASLTLFVSLSGSVKLQPSSLHFPLSCVVICCVFPDVHIDVG